MRAFAIHSVVAVLALPAGAAHAEPFTEARPQIAANVVYGGWANDLLDTDANAYGFGFGARAGYTLPVRIHLGASFEYFLGMGHNDSAVADDPPRLYEARASNLMFEPGYDIALAPSIVLRPQLGAGLMFPSSRGCSDCSESSRDPLASVTVGALLLYDFGPAFATAGLRYQQLLSSSESGALLLSLGGGAAF